jgi:hypothetical protein
MVLEAPHIARQLQGLKAARKVERRWLSRSVSVASMAYSRELHRSRNVVDQVQHSVVAAPGGPRWS